MKLAEIPQFTSDGSYQICVHLNYLERTLQGFEEDYGLELNPDFQRGHVWTEKQQIAWLEFFFKGGKTSRVIYFNSPEFRKCSSEDRDLPPTILCVDGLQRLTALRRFINNEIPIFGCYLDDFEDKTVEMRKEYIEFNVNSLQTRREVLQWYLDMNTGGTVHSDEEIRRVKALLHAEN